MKTFYDYLVLLEGPAIPPPSAGGEPEMGMPPPPMGGMGGMGGPPMGAPPQGGAGGVPGLPVQPKDAWKAIELTLDEIEKTPSEKSVPKKAGHTEENVVQNTPEKRHLLSVPGF